MKTLTCEHGITPKRNCKLCAAAIARKYHAEHYDPVKRAANFAARRDAAIVWQANQRAIKLGRAGTITLEYWLSINDSCYYCKAKGFPIELDHTIPIGNGGESTNENIRAVCVFCNRAKNDWPEEYFLKWLDNLRCRK